MPDFLDDLTLLGNQIVSLTLRIYTADAPDAQTTDRVYCNVVFSDGSVLYTPTNHRLEPPFQTGFPPVFGFARNSTHEFDLPLHDGLEQKISEIAELYIRKDGSNGWLLGSAMLFANGIDLPVLGNSQINQFLDDAEPVLFIRDWSTRSLCDSSALPAKYPLLCPHHRIAGPVLGQISAHTANILYRVDREGDYRLQVHDVASGQLRFDQVQALSPTATFEVGRRAGLDANTHYRFELFHVLHGQDVPVPDAGGEFRTRPAEDSRARFSFAFGSCSRSSRDASQSVWTRIRNLAPDPSIDPGTLRPPDDLQLFVHLGDSFYFYDDVTGKKEPRNLRTILAANLSQRRHPRFLDMARVVPSCAIWDDHDFRKNNTDSVDFAAKEISLDAFLRYWGNDVLSRVVDLPLGLTTLVTYGNVDIYLLDGRFQRDEDEGVCFGNAQLETIIGLIDARPTITGTDRLVVLASSSSWSHTNTKGEPYGDGKYHEERESFYGRLNARMGGSIKGLIFLSGDIHMNEVYHIELASSSGGPIKLAPEFVSSPLGRNTKLSRKGRKIVGERVESIPSGGKDGKTGFATLEIDATNAEPDGNWRVRARYYSSNASASSPYHTRDYVLRGGQFVLDA